MIRGGLFFTFVVTSSLVAFAQGCSSSNGSSAGGACANYVTALRDASKECGRFNVSPSREGDYIARYQRACEAALAAPGSGIAPSVLDQCAAKIREQCGDDDACEELFDDVRGSLGDGAACDDDTQCASGQCQRAESSQTTPTCGKCAASVQIGGACPDGGCVVGATCRSTVDGSSTERTCVATRTAGQGETCGTTVNEAIRCASGLYCKYDTVGSAGSTGTCASPVGEGEACGNEASQYARCKPPLNCVNDKCGRLLTAGQACSQSGDCASGLECDPSSNTCAAIVWGAIGSECDDNLRRCDRGFCSRTTSSSGTSATGTCVDFIADGQPCDQTKQLEQRCDTLSRCVSGTCQFPNPSQCQ